MSPIRSGEEGHLVDELHRIAALPHNPLEALEGTHFARFALVDSLGPGKADEGRRILASTYLLFAAAVDGSFEAYVEALRSPSFRVTADRIWGHCVGYEGTEAALSFRDYMRTCALPTRMFVPGYPGTVAEIRKAVADRDAVRDLAGRDLTDTELLDAFRSTLGSPSLAP